MHTPGPWHLNEMGDIFSRDGLTLIASIPPDVLGELVFTDPETQANARLLVAAPKLLEALKLLQAALTEHGLRDVQKRYSLCVADAAASTAIAQAEGWTP
jgi:hypothetical protein